MWNRLRLYGSYAGSVGENMILGDKSGQDYMIEMYMEDGKAMSNP